MWDFPQYTSGERAFSFSQGILETTGAGTRAGVGVGTGIRASRTALKILCKSSLEYLGTLVAAKDVGPGVPSGYLETSDSGGGEKPRGATEGAVEGATEGAMEGAMERRSRRGRPRPRTEIISELIFF